MHYSAVLKQFEKRNRTIRQLRGRGWTLNRIAKRYRISVMRVWQIVQDGKA